MLIRTVFFATQLFLLASVDAFAKDPKTTERELDFATFVKLERPSFVADASPKNCKEVSKKKKSITYEACIVEKKPYYIRMLDEGTPFGVVTFRSGRPVQYEGVENPEVKLLRGGKVVAILDESSKKVRTIFTTSEQKSLNQIAEAEVLSALSTFDLKP